MRHVGIFEAKTKLSQLVDAVMAGEEILITRNGKEAARLMPPKRVHDREAARRAVRELKEMRKGITLGGLTIKELINEGRHQ